MGRMAELAYEQQQSEQAAYEADMNYRESECARIIQKAQNEPITADEASLLRWACGVSK